MSGKARSQIHVKGLGDFFLAQISPVADADATDMGHLQEATIEDKWNPIKIKNDRGDKIDVIPTENEFSIDAVLLQTPKELIDVPRLSSEQYSMFRYFGTEDDQTFKYFASELCRIIPGFKLPMKSGLRTLGLRVESLSEQEFTYNVPMYYIVETNGVLRIQNLMLWASPRQGLNYNQTSLLDVSGWARHATLARTAMWQTGSTPTYFLRLNGTTDNADFGNVCNVNDTKDFGFQLMLRVEGADASLQEVFSKKADDTDAAIGYRLVRNTSNKLEFKISDGTNTATITSSTSVLHDVWTQVGLEVDRDGNAQMFINGAADGSPVDVSTVTGDCTNSQHLIIGKLSTGFGQIDVGDFRWYTYGVELLPSNFATLESQAFAAERAFYGL